LSNEGVLNHFSNYLAILQKKYFDKNAECNKIHTAEYLQNNRAIFLNDKNSE